MIRDYAKLANEARKAVLMMIHKAGTSHIASNFSVIDIATVLYENLKEGDEVVWSKGWAAATIYYFLEKQGKITKEQRDSFPNYPFLGLAETTVPGVWCNGGSVGHGLSVAVGMALGKKLKGEAGIIYCIMSDGGLNEGSVWEAVMCAAHHKLNNLVLIIDNNKWQAMGEVREVINLEPIEDRFMGFSWKVQRIDGHSYQEIEESLTTDFTELSLQTVPGDLINYGFTNVVDNSYKYKPMVIIADTVKGKGVSFMEDHLLYHYKHVDDNDYQKAVEELSR